MRRRKLKIPPRIPCLHCLVFQDSKRMLDGGRIRFCKSIENDISFDEPRASSCTDFNPSNYFWCEKSQQRIPTDVCLRRKQNRNSECKRCKTHLVILEIKKRENGQVVNSWRKVYKQPDIVTGKTKVCSS